jgi:hypothetical protein
MVTKQTDSLVNGCVVGRKNKQWWWYCIACGEGGMVSLGKNGKWVAEDRARGHECS